MGRGWSGTVVVVVVVRRIDVKVSNREFWLSSTAKCYFIDCCIIDYIGYYVVLWFPSINGTGTNLEVLRMELGS